MSLSAILGVQTKEAELEQALQKAQGTMPSIGAHSASRDDASKELLDRLHSEGYISDAVFEHATSQESTLLQKAGAINEHQGHRNAARAVQLLTCQSACARNTP